MSGELEIRTEDEDGGSLLYEVDYRYTAGSKERRYGHPDDWHAAEGPEIDIFKVRRNGTELKGHEIAEEYEWLSEKIQKHEEEN